MSLMATVFVAILVDATERWPFKQSHSELWPPAKRGEDTTDPTKEERGKEQDQG
jgi:hypothetical protein